MQRLGDPWKFRPIPPESLVASRLWEVSVPGSSRASFPQPATTGLTLTVHCMVQLHDPVLLSVPAWGALHILPGLHRLSVLRVDRQSRPGASEPGGHLHSLIYCGHSASCPPEQTVLATSMPPT